MEVPFDILGTVIPGSQRGRELGYATANVALPTDLPDSADGIYAARVTVLGIEKPFMAAAFIGKPTTFANEPRRAEAHLLDYDATKHGELAGKEIAITFVYFIRKSKRFSSPEELSAAISGDVRATQRFFESDHPAA